MFSPRIILGIAIIAMTVTMFVPLQLWAAVSLIGLSIVAAIIAAVLFARGSDVL